MDIVLGLFLVTIAASIGGFIARFLKLPSLVGYIIAGVAFGTILPENLRSVSDLAQLGTILLLFSIGVELSFEKLARFLNVAVFGASIQIILVTGIGFSLLRLFGMDTNTAIVLASGFSLSSTIVVVKILSDRGELETIHGGVMLGWLLVQDLAVIPMMVMLPILANVHGSSLFTTSLISLGEAFLVVATTVLLGKMFVPKIIRKVTNVNSRELLLLLSIALALGIATATSFLGISPALGAFLSGVVISGSQEKHAIFAETRPLRDLFVALFFVTLGLLIDPSVLFSKALLILALTAVVIILKILVVFFVAAIFRYKGRTGVATSFGLSQVGEFAFVIFSSALGLNLLNQENASLGISVTLVTLIVTPILFKSVLPFWRKIRNISSGSFLAKLFSVGEKHEGNVDELADHIVICGFGRVGKWVGKALTEFKVPFVVVEYNQETVNELRQEGVVVLYGDSTEPEVLEAVKIRNAKAVILAIPDRVTQETLIAYVQTVAPNVKIISRVHLDTDWEKLKTLRVDKIVQPEFEAAIEIVRSVLMSRGKTKDEISEAVKSLRVSHSKKF